MRLRTKDGWLLTEEVSKMIIEQSHGESIEEIAKYVSRQSLRIDDTDTMYFDTNIRVRPPKYYLGIYEVYGNKEGIIATT